MVIITLKKDEYIGNIYIDNPKYIIGQNAIDYSIDFLLKHTDNVRNDCNIYCPLYENGRKWEIVLNKNNGEYPLTYLDDNDLLNLINKVEILDTSLQEYFYVDDVLIPEVIQIIKDINKSDEFQDKIFSVKKCKQGGSFEITILYYGFENYRCEERSKIIRDLFYSRLKNKKDLFKIFFYDASWENYGGQ